MDRQFVTEPAVEVGKRREPADENAQRSRESNPPPGAVTADPSKKKTPYQGTDHQHDDFVQSIGLQISHGLLDNIGMVDLPKKNQPEQQPGRQAEEKPGREGALPGDTKIVRGFLDFHCGHKVIYASLPILHRESVTGSVSFVEFGTLQVGL